MQAWPSNPKYFVVVNPLYFYTTIKHVLAYYLPSNHLIHSTTLNTTNKHMCVFDLDHYYAASDVD